MPSKEQWFSSASEPRRITEAEMRLLLHDAYTDDPETSFLRLFTRGLADPATAPGANSSRHLHPLWLVFGVATTLVGLIFATFNLIRR